MNKKLHRIEHSIPKEEDEAIRASVVMIEEMIGLRLFDKCLDPTTKVLEKPMLDATRGILLYRRADIYWKLCQNEQAEIDFLEAERITSTNGSRSYHLGVVTAFSNFCSYLAQLHKDNPEKKKYYEDLCLEKSNYCVKNGHDHKHFLHNNRGSILADRKKYDEAMKSYERAIKIDSRDFWAYRGIANICLEKEQYANAIKYFDEAIRLAVEKTPANDILMSQLSEDIEKMKESRKKASELLSSSGQKSTLLPAKGQQEEEQKSTFSKELKFIQSFEFSDLALEVPNSIKEEPTLQITSRKLSNNHHFEIIQINSEGGVYIVHAGTGLALTAINNTDNMNNTDNEDTKNKTPCDSKLTEIAVSSDKSPNVVLLEFKQSPYQLWRLETEDVGRSKIISVANEKKLCAIYENDKKTKFLTKKMKINETGRITLQEKVEHGIDFWLLSPLI